MTRATIALIGAKLCRQEWSQQQISAWLAKTHQISIRGEQIYQHIWAGKHGGGTPSRKLKIIPDA